jgi:hypothetical protein
MSDKTINDEFDDINDLVNYTPFDAQCYRYDTNVIFAAVKIVDLYTVLCTARTNLLFLDSEEGIKSIAKTENEENLPEFMKSMFIQDALLYYNFAVDYSWQILWLYYDDTIINRVPQQKLLDDCSSNCTYEGLRLQLTLKKDLKMRTILESFFAKKEYNFIRQKYNYLKHRGSLFFRRMGSILDNGMLNYKINGEDLLTPFSKSEEIDLDMIKSSLILFDKVFIKYIRCIIEIIMPKDYFNTYLSNEQLMKLPFKYIENQEKMNKNII